MSEIYKFVCMLYQLLFLLWILNMKLNFEIFFEFGIIVEFLLYFFSYFNNASSPFFLTSLIIFTEIGLF